MKEIKFRGKRVDNGEWMYGYYYWDGKFPFIIVNNEDRYVFFGVIPETVGEYTGLKDKNGKEIYKGSLIKIVDEIFEVVWHFNRWVIKSVKTGRIKEFRKIDVTAFYEIIGNIHDDPEMMEQK